MQQTNFLFIIGSALSKKAPTDRYPNGFGRLVNLVLLGAVIIVGIMSYETIKEGYHHILHPTESTGTCHQSFRFGSCSHYWRSFVLYKAMKEVLHEAHIEAKGFAIVTKSFSSLKRAKPATKLVFMEDFVATLRWNHCHYWNITFLFCRLACSRRILLLLLSVL